MTLNKMKELLVNKTTLKKETQQTIDLEKRDTNFERHFETSFVAFLFLPGMCLK